MAETISDGKRRAISLTASFNIIIIIPTIFKIYIDITESKDYKGLFIAEIVMSFLFIINVILLAAIRFYMRGIELYYMFFYAYGFLTIFPNIFISVVLSYHVSQSVKSIYLGFAVIPNIIAFFYNILIIFLPVLFGIEGYDSWNDSKLLKLKIIYYYCNLFVFIHFLNNKDYWNSF